VKAISYALLFLCNLCFAAEGFRISTLSFAPGENIQRFETPDGTWAYVHDQELLNSDHIDEAELDAKHAGVIALTLSREGMENINQSLVHAGPQGSRLALIFDKQLYKILYLQQPLTRQRIELYGFDRWNQEELKRLALRMRGEEQAPAELPVELPVAPLFPEKAESAENIEGSTDEPDEAFAHLQTLRQHMGIFLLNELPPADRVDTWVQQKRRAGELIQELGPPSTRPSSLGQGRVQFEYHLAPERLVPESGEGSEPCGLILFLHQGQLQAYRYQYKRLSTDVAAEFPLASLRLRLPGAPPDPEDPAYLRFVEDIEVAEIGETVSQADLRRVESFFAILEHLQRRNPNQTLKLDLRCDLLQLMARHHPTVLEAITTYDAGKIPVHRIHEAIQKQQDAP